MLGFGQTARRKADDTATTLTLDRLIACRAEANSARLASTRGLTHLPGGTRTKLRGEGLDFDELRPYAEGDDVRHIDWNVTARSGRLHTRLYHRELERAVTVAVDFRPPMFTGSQRLKAVVAGEYAAALLWQISANRDRAGVLIFDGQSSLASRPTARQRGVLESLGLIASAFEAARSAANHDQPTQKFDHLLSSINALPRSAGLTLFLTDADDLGPDFELEASMAGQRERLVIIRLVDLLEMSGLTAGRYSWKRNAQRGLTDIGASGAALIKRQLGEANAALDATLSQHGLPVVTISTDTPSGDIWLRLAAAGVV